MTNAPMPLPGWYPDPSGGPGQRYWDGQKWTEGPAPEKKSKKKWLIGAGAAVVLLIAIANTSGHDKQTVNTSASVPSAPSAPAPAKPAADASAPAGSSVRDGKFEFQVLGAPERSEEKEGWPVQHAKGEFYTLKIRVTNIGDRAQSFSASNQKLIIDGKKYDATSSLSDNTWTSDINPGLGLEGTVTFDIPQGAVPEAIEFHDSMFSGGARVAL